MSSAYRASGALYIPGLFGNMIFKELPDFWLRKMQLWHAAAASWQEEGATSLGFEADRQLFAAMAGGNSDSFEIYYKNNCRQVYSYCLRICKSRMVAAELMQTVFVKLWVSRGKLQDVKNPAAYLMRIVANVIADYFVAEKNKRQLKEINEQTSILPTGAIDEAFNRRNMMSLVDEAIRQLPSQQQRIFLMNKYEGLSYKEISIELKISVSAVNFSLVEAMKKVRAYVAGKTD